jgi:hypothetical protein
MRVMRLHELYIHFRHRSEIADLYQRAYEEFSLEPENKE